MLRLNSQQYRAQIGCERPPNKARQTESVLLRMLAPRARASGERSIHRLLWPVFRPRDPAVQAVCQVVAVGEQGVLQIKAPTRLDDPVDGADTIISTCLALLKERQTTRDDYREMVQLTVVFGGEVDMNIRKPGAYHCARRTAKVIYTLKITLFRERFALNELKQRALIRFRTFIVTT